MRKHLKLSVELLESRVLMAADLASSVSVVATTPTSTANNGVVGSQGVEPINGVGNNIANPTLGAGKYRFCADHGRQFRRWHRRAQRPESCPRPARSRT